MRALRLICLTIPLYGLPAIAQPAVSIPTGNQERLDELLKKYANRMSGLQSLSANVTREEKSPLTRKSTTFKRRFCFDEAESVSSRADARR